MIGKKGSLGIGRKNLRKGYNGFNAVQELEKRDQVLNYLIIKG